MKNAGLRVLFLTAIVSMAGCASEGEGESDPSSSMDANGEHPPGHMDGNMTGGITEMYAVATDLSSTPQTWFRYRPETFSAKVGDTLNVTLKAAVGNTYPHSLVMDALDVSLGPLNAGAAESTEIVLTKAGTYTFYCAEGNHQELGMQGTLTVS